MMNAYFTDSIMIVQSRGYDKWNEPLPDVRITIMGRFEFVTKLVRNLEGEEVVATAKAYLPNMSLNHKDRIKYDGIEYAVLEIEKIKDFQNSHLEVYVR